MTRCAIRFGSNVADEFFAEFEGSKDEEIRKALLEMVHDTTGDELWIDYNVHKENALAWLEKQGENSVRWNENTDDNKPQKHHSVLMKTTHGIAEGEWQGEKWIQYRWSSSIKDSDVLFWIELSDIEKQGETFPVLSNSSNIGKDEQKHKYNIGDIITNGKVTYRVDKIVKNCLGKDSYFLVDIEVEKNWPQEPDFIDFKRKRFNYGEITWLCDQVDKSFRKIGEQKPIEENNGNLGGISPNWSEEDERLCQCLIEDQKETLDKVRNNKYGHSEIISDLKEMYHERIDWLKSLKQRIMKGE